jgi:hypothetical protein
MKTISTAGVRTRRSTRPPVQRGLSEAEAARRLPWASEFFALSRSTLGIVGITLAGIAIAIAGLAVTDVPGRVH